LLQRDIPALEKIWADDYVFVNASGEVLTKAQRLANAKSGATTLDSIKEEERLRARLQNSAVATSRVTIKGTVQWSTDHRPVPKHHVWVRVLKDGNWFLNQLTLLPQK
jgi:hypothetical protein